MSGEASPDPTIRVKPARQRHFLRTDDPNQMAHRNDPDMTRAAALQADLQPNAPAHVLRTDDWAPPKGGYFAFTHQALRQPGGRFERDANRIPCFKIDLGDIRAAIPLLNVPVTFEIPRDHPDRALLARIPAALNFASAIYPDAPIPNEIVDGSPSWVPRAEYLDRATRRLARALGMGEETTAIGVPAAAAFGSLARRMADTGRKPALGEIFDVVGGTARADWLCRRVVAVQGLVGDLARAGAAHASKSAAEAARAGALALREAAIWAGRQAMNLDAATADPVAALTDPATFRAKAYPALAALRAFAIDAGGLVAAWRALRDKPEGALSTDIETLASTAVARYARFDPRKFETYAARRPPSANGAIPFPLRSAP